MEGFHLFKRICLRERFKSLLRKLANLCSISSSSGQASLEYLLVVALTFAIMVPTVYLFYNYSKESSQEIVDSQITKIGRALVDTSESIFYSGQNSKTVLELNMPDNILGTFIIDGRELVFNVSTPFGISEIVFFSAITLTTVSSNCKDNVCTIPELVSSGLKEVRIEAISKESVKIETI